MLASALIFVGPARSAPDLVNSRLAADFFELDGTRVAFLVSEYDQGGRDLNGDGDAADFVLHVLDTRSGKTTNVGLAVGSERGAFASNFFDLDGSRVAFLVSESAQGESDLNGDGDAADRVLHVFEARSGETTNLGLASNLFELDGRLVAFLVDESAQGGRDLNGDGDAGDLVLHVFDARTGKTTNVALASGAFQLAGSLVAFRVPEGDQGERDLNGDGDAGDLVLHVLDARSGKTTNLGLASDAFQLDRSRVAFLASEYDQGESDLNGDGDAADLVLHVFDARSGKTTNVGLAAFGSDFRQEGSRIAFLVDEYAQGETDLNGDGDVVDLVLHVFDARSGKTTNAGLAVTPHFLELERGRVAVGVSEYDQGGRDLNGDGDAEDLVLHLVEAKSGQVTNVGLDVSGGLRVDGNRVALGVDEARQDNTDLNGDGDAFDVVLHVLDARTGKTTNVGLDVSGFFELAGSLVAVGVNEAAQGETDLNGDGDVNDLVLHVFDARSGETTNVGLETSPFFQLEGRRVAFLVSEGNQGESDLNGDGDALDFVLYVLVAR